MKRKKEVCGIGMTNDDVRGSRYIIEKKDHVGYIGIVGKTSEVIHKITHDQSSPLNIIHPLSK